jgi:hypothetical protein
MKKSHLTHLIWIIPILLGVLLAQQLAVLWGIDRTYQQGDEYTAYITDFRIKQIAAQTNGYVDLQFFTDGGETVEERLSLHAQHAQRLIGANTVNIRYLPGTTYDIVMVETYEYHRSTVLINISVLSLSMIVLIMISLFASRFAVRQQREGNSGELNLEYINSPA